MVNRALIQALHDKGIIDKRNVLWWQLGFEGRRVFTEQEFQAHLKRISYETSYDDSRRYNSDSDIPAEHLRAVESAIWTSNDVPVLIRELDFEGLKVPFFISVKPASHDKGQEAIERECLGKRQVFPLSLYLSPHIRGISLELTDRFFFWYPITFGDDDNIQSTNVCKVKSLSLPIIKSPISPGRFYRSLVVERSWSNGRRAQKKTKEFDCKKEGFEIVPYFEFNPCEPNIMVYPVPLRRGKLDLPVLVKSRPPNHPPEVLGTGYFQAISAGGLAYYWEIDKQRQRLARDTLIERLT